MVADKPISFGSLEFHLTSTMAGAPAKAREDAPFRLLVMGDFSGRAGRGALRTAAALADLRPIKVDRDTIETLPGKLGAALSLTLAEGDSPLGIRFDELEDFHPDSLFDRLSIFQKMRQVRRELQSSATFKSAAAEVRSWLNEDVPIEKEKALQPASPPVSSAATVSVAAGSLLDMIVEETAGISQAPGKGVAAGDTGLEQFLKMIVTPHLVAADNPQEEELVAAVDSMIAALMRAILHHADFQALEAIWRGLQFLCSRLETDEQLQVLLLDLNKEELASDLLSASDLSKTGMYRILVEKTVETPGGNPWSAVIGDYCFDGSSDDAELLGRLAMICARAGAPFLAGASARLVGCDSLAATPDPHDWQLSLGEKDQHAWAMLRALPEASFIGLALPRFLLRLPYGDATDAIDRFAFDEMGGKPVHSSYLWGNPVFACGCLIGQVFSQNGWQLQLSDILDVNGLPLHLYKENGEVKVKPCAEVLLTQKAAEQMLDQGLMPLLSFKEQDKVRLARFQSIADPLTRLSGPWR